MPRPERLPELAVLLKRKYGQMDRAERLSVLGGMVGRPLWSSTKLTQAEVHRLIERLRAKPDVCLTPNKVRYATALAARRAADSDTALRGAERTPYACPCGWWHLTTHHRGGQLRVSSDGTVYKRKRRPKAKDGVE